MKYRWMPGVGFLLLFLAIRAAFAQQEPTAKGVADGSWHFAVSGDSRNCGDVIMPTIAQKVRQDGAMFYWHLGDYRAIYDFDQDFKARNPFATISAYQDSAWRDFIENQLHPFGDLPVYLTLGNHETIPPKTRAAALLQFAEWFNRAEVRTQRLADDSLSHEPLAYYHWTHGGVDFIALDNSTADQFDAAQMAWFTKRLDGDVTRSDVRSLVVGMHEAFPDGMSTGHSMNESAQGTESGRKAYQQLVEFRQKTHKNV